jgi:hypothetical protein
MGMSGVTVTVVTLNQGMNSVRFNFSFDQFGGFIKMKFTKCRKIVHCFCSSLNGTTENIH